MNAFEVPSAIGEITKKVNPAILLVFSFFASSFLHVLAVANAKGPWLLAALIAFVVGPAVIRASQFAIVLASEQAGRSDSDLIVWSVFWLDMLWMVGIPAFGFAAGAFLTATHGFFHVVTWHGMPFTAAYFFGAAAANAAPMLPASTKRRAQRW